MPSHSLFDDIGLSSFSGQFIYCTELSFKEMAPVFRDDHGGYSYKLEAFCNVETKAIYRVENLKGEISSDNRIRTLDQI